MLRAKMWTLILVVALLLPGPAMPIPAAATRVQMMTTPVQGVTVPAERIAGSTATQSTIRNLQSAISETGVYTETFVAYTAKDYAENAEWDISAHTLRLMYMDGFDQIGPSTAVDGNGDALVVWCGYQSSHYDIYARKLDAGGNRLWAADVRVNSDSGNTDQSSPAVALDGNGNAFVVWLDTRNGVNSDLYAQRLDASGNKLWSADLLVSTHSTPVWEWAPGVAVDGGGNVVVVWHDVRNGNEDIFAQKLDAAGHKLWPADVRVNSDGGTAYQDAPAIALDETGNAIIVWHDARNSGNSDIYAQKLNASGAKLWAADVRVNSDGGTANQWNTTVAAYVNGGALVVWQDYRNGDTDVYAQKLDADGAKLWATDTRVNSDAGPGNQYCPVVAVDGNGNAIITWEDWRNEDIYAQRLDASGNKLWAADVRVNSDSGMADQSSPAMAVEPASGNAIVVWTDNRNGNYDIYTQRLDASGNKLWAADARVNSASGTADQEYPAVAVEPVSGNSIVVWEDSRNSYGDIYVQRLDVSGNELWVADVRVNSESGTAEQRYPAVAVEPASGNAIVIWQDYRNDSGDIYAQRLDASGNKLWSADVRVNSDSGAASQWSPAVAVEPASGNAMVVWEDGRNGNGNIYAQRLDASGNKLWATDVRVNSESGTANQNNPAVAVEPASGNAIVVWQDSRNGNEDIYAQKVGASGNRLWAADVRVNSDSGTADQRYPVVAVEPASGSAILVWYDDRNGNGDIYAQRLDAVGNKQWAVDVRTNSDSGTADQWSPAVGVESASGNVVVVWHDARNGHGDIYGQQLDASGNKQWTADTRVNSDGGTAERDSPVVAVEPASGNAIVAWQDGRNGNWDIYTQKINAVGGRGWLADLQVVYPDVFYFVAGIAQSRSVDMASGDIRQATLTANYQANGGSVQFYLTNNGGANWFTAPLGVATVLTTTGSDLRWRAVLTGDPVWRHRTPLVNSLRIEYSTQIPYADDYEPDDACAQARPIAVNGAAQAHTFHQNADADWVWFDVISGTTYIVETYNIGSRAQTVAEPHRTCEAPPAGTGRSFGNGYTFSFTADQTGRYYVKVSNHSPSVYGQDTGYNLSVRSLQPRAVAIIVAGHDSANSVQENITYAADRAYKVFLNAGLGKANVRYLSALADHDADGDGNNDISGPPTPANVQGAIQTWARERGVALGVPLYIYLVDHGLVDRFKADGDALTSHVTATDLNLWLTNLEATTGTDNLNIIVDACYSGSFIDVTTSGPAAISIEGRPRVIIASTTSDWQAFGPADGKGLYFSNAFFGAVENEQSLWAAYLAGKQAVEAQGLLQRPWLDDNGDAIADSRDGELAAGRALQRVALGGRAPQIEWVTANRTDGVIRAKVMDDSVWVGVKVEVFAPSYVPPAPDGSGTTRIINVPVMTLTDPDGDRVYEGTYAFAETGRYRLVAHAEDAEGNLALPVSAFTGYSVYLPLLLR